MNFFKIFLEYLLVTNLLKTFMPLLPKKLTHIRAARAVPLLLELAIKQRTITYGEMAKRLNMKNPRHVVAIISLAGEVIDDFFMHSSPDICSLVVSKSTGIPGNGFFKHEAEHARYLALSQAEKISFMQARQQEVFEFANWTELLPLAKDFCKYYL